MRESAPKPKKISHGKAAGACACGAVRIEIDVPAFWAWHDHSKATQRAQGCAYALYRRLAQPLPHRERRPEHRTLRGCGVTRGAEASAAHAARRFSTNATAG